MTEQVKPSAVAGDEPGIAWTPGDEDYPFAAAPHEGPIDFFTRWLASAPYARLERNGVRYLHEGDVANLLNHVTADVGLIRARLDSFGDRVITAEEFDETVQRIEDAAASLAEALDRLGQARA